MILPPDSSFISAILVEANRCLPKRSKGLSGLLTPAGHEPESMYLPLSSLSNSNERGSDEYPNHWPGPVLLTEILRDG